MLRWKVFCRRAAKRRPTSSSSFASPDSHVTYARYGGKELESVIAFPSEKMIFKEENVEGGEMLNGFLNILWYQRKLEKVLSESF